MMECVIAIKSLNIKEKNIEDCYNHISNFMYD